MFFIPLMSTTSQDRWLHVKQEEQETMLVDRVIQQARTWEIYVINGPNGLKLFNKPWMGHLMLTCILIGGVPCSTNILKALTIILKVNLMMDLMIAHFWKARDGRAEAEAERAAAPIPTPARSENPSAGPAVPLLAAKVEPMEPKSKARFQN